MSESKRSSSSSRGFGIFRGPTVAAPTIVDQRNLPIVFVSYDKSDVRVDHDLFNAITGLLGVNRVIIQKHEDEDDEESLKAKIRGCDLVIVFFTNSYMGNLFEPDMETYGSISQELYEEAQFITRYKLANNRVLAIACENNIIANMRRHQANMQAAIEAVNSIVEDEEIPPEYWWSRFVVNPMHVFNWNIRHADAFNQPSLELFLDAVRGFIMI